MCGVDGCIGAWIGWIDGYMGHGEWMDGWVGRCVAGGLMDM